MIEPSPWKKTISDVNDGILIAVDKPQKTYYLALACSLTCLIIGIIAWGPQIRQVWVHKRHDGISIPTFGIVALSLFMWLLYGLAIGSMAMVIANIMTLSVILIIIMGVLRCRKAETLDAEEIS